MRIRRGLRTASHLLCIRPLAMVRCNPWAGCRPSSVPDLHLLPPPRVPEELRLQVLKKRRLSQLVCGAGPGRSAVMELFLHAVVVSRLGSTALKWTGAGTTICPGGEFILPTPTPLEHAHSNNWPVPFNHSGTNTVRRSHVLELENRIKWLESIVGSRCPDIDLVVGPPVELRSRPTPPDIRIVTSGVQDFGQSHSMSAASSPINFPHSPASTIPTPVSFEFSSPGGSYLHATSPFGYPGSDIGTSSAPSIGPSSPYLQPQDTMAHEICLLSLSRNIWWQRRAHA